MARKFEYTKNRFDGGVSDDLRLNTTNSYAITKHFDFFSGRKQLMPFRDLVADETKSFDIVKFVYAEGDLYGLGVVSGTTRPKIFIKDGDPITDVWVEDTAGGGMSAQANGNARSEDVFFYYRDHIYGWRGGPTNGYLWRWGLLSASFPTFDASYQTIAFTTVAQPVHHPADDSAYFFADNKVYRYNGVTSTWDDLVLTLPESLKITSATDYGNYLAIGCSSTNIVGESVVFLWDRDSSLTDLSASIPWGTGELKVLGTVEGSLIGISSNSASAFSLDSKVTLRQLINNEASIFKVLDTTTDFTYTMGSSSIEQNGKLYFTLYEGTTGTDLTGIWAIGRKTANDPLSVSMSHKVTPDDTGKIIQGFTLIDDYLFVAHGEGSVDRTNNTASYTETSIYESEIFSDDQPNETKQFKHITVTFSPLPTVGQVVLKYRKDEETSWTTLFTHTIGNSIRKTATVIPHFKEIQLRVESTKGAIITGLFGKGEYIEDDIIS